MQLAGQGGVKRKMSKSGRLIEVPAKGGICEFRRESIHCLVEYNAEKEVGGRGRKSSNRLIEVESKRENMGGWNGRRVRGWKGRRVGGWEGWREGVDRRSPKGRWLAGYGPKER